MQIPLFAILNLSTILIFLKKVVFPDFKSIK
jgi:hypothetical protein